VAWILAFLNEAESTWGFDSGRIAAVVVLSVLQTVLIVGLLIHRAQRKRAEQAAREAGDRLGLALRAAQMDTWDWDVRANQITCSECATPKFGASPPGGRFTLENFLSCVHPDDRKTVQHAFEQSLARGVPYEKEFRVVRPDGKVLWLMGYARVFQDEGGKPIRMVGVTIDITERKLAQEALRESEARYRNVVETQTELICRYLPDTTLTFVNEAYCRYFGRSRDELIGTKFIELIPESSRMSALQIVESVATNSSEEQYEHEVLRPDGSIGWQQWRDHALLDADGRVTEIQAVGRDITEQRRAELQTQQQRLELMHLSRAATLGELSGALAHELNQPLAAILSNAQAAQRHLWKNPIDVEEVREILNDIVEDDKRASEVLRRLRGLLTKGETQMQTVDLNEVVRDTLRVARAELLTRNVGVALRLASDLHAVRGDRVQLQQLLLNLIVNACDAMAGNAPDERRLIISTRNCTASDNGNEKYVELVVMDRGVGFQPGALEHVFDAFFTTKETGLGLGLTIARSIAAAHSGRLWAEIWSGMRSGCSRRPARVHRGGS